MFKGTAHVLGSSICDVLGVFFFSEEQRVV